MPKARFKKFKKHLSALGGFDQVVKGAARDHAWAGYASALGAIENLADEGKSTKKTRKRRRQTVKFLTKLAKHAHGSKSLRPPRKKLKTKKKAAPPAIVSDAAATAHSEPAPDVSVARLIGTPDDGKVVSLSDHQSQSAGTDATVAGTQEVSAAPPPFLDGPRDGVADDLQLIAGVGPKLEQVLNGLGIFHFDQIANWGDDEVAWVDEHLKFSGRIGREDWINQAAALARGGRDEYVRVFGKEPR